MTVSAEFSEVGRPDERGDAPSSERAIAMGRLDDEIGTLAKAVSMLADRLRPVLAPERPEQATDARIAAADVGQSMHVQDLIRFRGKIEGLRAQLDDVIMRCEV